MHSSNRSAHHVGSGRVWIVSWAALSARHARVGVINVAAMSMAVVPILPTLVGRGRLCRLLRTGTVAAKPSWLLWEASSTVATAGTTIASVAALVELLLLGRGVDGRWGLLVDSHAELLDAR